MYQCDLVDFHAHILPRADHGSDSVKTSVAQLKLASSYGVNRIVATPHFYPHRHTLSSFLRRREKAYYELKEHLTEEMPEIRLGAEVLICDNIDRFVGLEYLCVYGTNILLLELPFNDFSENFCASAENLIGRGFEIVLAHADRYDRVNIDKMVNVGAKIQLNAQSIATFFKDKDVYDYAKQGLVVALGSDIHSVNPKAYKRFDKAKLKFEEYIETIKKNSDMLWERAKPYSRIEEIASL